MLETITSTIKGLVIMIVSYFAWLETITSTIKGLVIMIVSYFACFVLLGVVVGSMVALFKFGFNTALNLLS